MIKREGSRGGNTRLFFTLFLILELGGAIISSVEGRRIKYEIFIPPEFINSSEIIFQHLAEIEEKFGEVIAFRVANLKLGERYIGIEALAREETIGGAEPLIILRGILETHISETSIEDIDWKNVADEIRFFLDIPSQLSEREAISQEEIIDRSIVIDELVRGVAITTGEAERYFILAKNISHCIVLTFYDRGSHTGGMAYMVWAPQFAPEAKKINLDRITEILNQFQERGSPPEKLEVQMFGGKLFLNEDDIREIIFITRIYQTLRERNIKIIFQDILGSAMRDIGMNTINGEIYDLLK